MDLQVKNFNTRLRTIKIRELVIGLIIAFVVSLILTVIFPAIGENDDLFMIVVLLLLSLFFIWCLRSTEGLYANIQNIFLDDNKKEILYILVINFIFAYVFLFCIAFLDMMLGIADSTWISVIDIDSVDLTPSAFLFSAIASIIFAPVLEELIFRGVLFNRLKIRAGIVPAMLISSFLFAIGHDFGGMISAFVFGMCMCILYLKTDNIFIPMTVHFLNNVFATLLETTNIDAILVEFPWIILLGILILISALLLLVYIIQETQLLKKRYS